jgi:carboxymethylenebutenolidase
VCYSFDAMSIELTRRSFVATAAFTGFALSVTPVSADTIVTDANGLVAGDVKIGDMPGYRAMPEGKGPFPLVVVIQEVFGVHEHIKDMCRRFAKAGYMAVAPELYYRQGDVKNLKDLGDVLKVVYKVPDEQVAKDLDATVAWAKAQGKVDGKRIAAVGWCWGGRQAWLFAAHANLKAAAAYYGPISNAPTALQPKSPIDIASKLTTPVIGFYGGKDGHIPVSQVELMKKELATGKSGSEIHVYPNADHGFNADYRPMYNKEAAEDAWKKLLEWFKKNGV